MSKKLVAYFSASKVTEKVANKIAEAAGADIYNRLVAMVQRRSQPAERRQSESDNPARCNHAECS